MSRLPVPLALAAALAAAAIWPPPLRAAPSQTSPASLARLPRGPRRPRGARPARGRPLGSRQLRLAAAEDGRSQGEMASEGAAGVLPRLWYFKGRGKAEIIRFALGASGVEWEDCFLRRRAEMLHLLQSGKLLFDQVPMLELPTGKCIVQTTAILRYVAETHGLHGETPEERADVDALVEGANDLLGGLIGLPFQAAGLPSSQRPEEGLSRLASFHIPRYFGAFEKHLRAQSEGTSEPWMVGKKLTVADTSILRCVEDCVEWLGEGCVQQYPRLAQWRKAVLAHPQIQRFMSGPHRQPAPAIREVANVYCHEVGDALGRA